FRHWEWRQPDEIAARCESPTRNARGYSSAWRPAFVPLIGGVARSRGLRLFDGGDLAVLKREADVFLRTLAIKIGVDRLVVDDVAARRAIGHDVAAIARERAAFVFLVVTFVDPRGLGAVVRHAVDVLRRLAELH